MRPLTSAAFIARIGANTRDLNHSESAAVDAEESPLHGGVVPFRRATGMIKALHRLPEFAVMRVTRAVAFFGQDPLSS
jgi:hypothetical protein